MGEFAHRKKLEMLAALTKPNAEKDRIARSIETLKGIAAYETDLAAMYRQRGATVSANFHQTHADDYNYAIGILTVMLGEQS